MNESSFSLPPQCTIRPASAQDIKSIRRLVWSAKLDPTQLRWQQFWVIECSGKLAACGQLRNFEGARELGSLVVAKDWRDRGLGSYLTKYLIQQATEPAARIRKRSTDPQSGSVKINARGYRNQSSRKF